MEKIHRIIKYSKLRIRMSRTGPPKSYKYTIRVADTKAPRDGRHIEEIGIYSPLETPQKLTISRDRAKYWLGMGAEPSDTVAMLFGHAKILPKVPEPPKKELKIICSFT